MCRQRQSRQHSFRHGLLSCVWVCVAVCTVGGCAPVGDPAPNGDPGTDGTVAITGRINSILANASLSVDDPAITIFYTVTGTPDSISAFFVPVADNSGGAIEIGPPQNLAQNLPASGNNAFFQFFPSGVGVGFYRVGIQLTTGGQVIEAVSDGVIQVQGRPDPCFAQPCTVAAAGTPADQTFTGCGELICVRVVEIPEGDQDGVTVSFDAGDPDGDVQWRLFFLRDTDSISNPADQLGEQILIGSGNVAFVAFSTADLLPGDFELGVSATDSGLSIAQTVEADGDNSRIVTVLGPVVRVVP